MRFLINVQNKLSISQKYDVFEQERVYFKFCLFVTTSHQTQLDTWSKAWRPIKVGIKGRGRSGTSWGLEPYWSMLLIGSLGAMWAWWAKQFHEPKCRSGHICRVMAWLRQQGLVPYIGFEKVRGGPLYIYRCVPPTHEYGTRPFLRWARSQGRSPHASGKAKNTFGPVGIPFLGRLRRQAINPTPPKGV